MTSCRKNMGSKKAKRLGKKRSVKHLSKKRVDLKAQGKCNAKESSNEETEYSAKIDSSKKKIKDLHELDDDHGVLRRKSTKENILNKSECIENKSSPEQMTNNIKLTLKKFVSGKHKSKKKGAMEWKICSSTIEEPKEEKETVEKSSNFASICKDEIIFEDDVEEEIKSQENLVNFVSDNHVNGQRDSEENVSVIDEDVNKSENEVIGKEDSSEFGYNTIFFKEDLSDTEFERQLNHSNPLENCSQDNAGMCGQNLIILKKLGQCAVPGCSTMGGHVFPPSVVIQEKWMKFAGITNCAGEHICEKHFIQNDYYVIKTVYGWGRLAIKSNAVPTIRIDESQKKNLNIQVETVDDVEDFDSSKHSRCTVLGCFNFGGFLYPEKLSVRLEWLQFTGRQEWELVEGFNVICQDHFDDRNFYLVQTSDGTISERLKSTAIPSINRLASHFIMKRPRVVGVPNLFSKK